MAAWTSASACFIADVAYFDAAAVDAPVAFAIALDGLPSPDTTETGALITQPFNPLQRTPIEHVLDTGVRPINALLTVGRGQRMGLFAGSGVGKSVLDRKSTRLNSSHRL